MAASACSDDTDQPREDTEARPNLGQGDYALAVTVFAEDSESGYVALTERPRAC